MNVRHQLIKDQISVPHSIPETRQNSFRLQAKPTIKIPVARFQPAQSTINRNKEDDRSLLADSV